MTLYRRYSHARQQFYRVVLLRTSLSACLSDLRRLLEFRKISKGCNCWRHGNKLAPTCRHPHAGTAQVLANPQSTG